VAATCWSSAQARAGARGKGKQAMKLVDTVAVVTGAGRGIGRAIAEAQAEAGAFEAFAAGFERRTARRRMAP
jgi:hypothetical protein